jgi:hypothetical protein
MSKKKSDKKRSIEALMGVGNFLSGVKIFTIL